MPKSKVKAALRRAAARCVNRDLAWHTMSALPEQYAYEAAVVFERGEEGAPLPREHHALFLLIVAEVL